MTPDLGPLRCVVLGAGGFLGRHLVPELAGRAAAVRVFGRGVEHLALPPAVEAIEGDFLDPAALQAAVEGVDVVFHLVSTTSPATAEGDRRFDIATNLIGTVSLLELCCNLNVRRVVFVSSGGTVYGDVDSDRIHEGVLPRPISSYGITKLAIERHVHLFNRRHGMRNVVLRVANPFGPFQYGRGGQGVIGTFMRAVARGDEVSVWGGQAVRDYVFVRDVAQALLAAAVHEGDDEVFNIGTGIGRSTLDVIAAIERTAGRPLRRRLGPPRAFDVAQSVLDVTAARTRLGWQAATPWDDALRATWDWILADEAGTGRRAAS